MSIERIGPVRLGRRVVTVDLEAGRIKRISPSGAAALAILLPPLVDIHVHLDKTYAADRTPTRAKSLHEAIELGAADKAHWTHRDIRTRASRALGRAEANGIGAMRSHVDWSDPAPPRAWDVITELTADWRGRIALQRAALVPLDLLADPDHGPAIAARVAKTGGVLGAFVFHNADHGGKLDAVFGLGMRHDLMLDFHVDEHLDAEAIALEHIAELTKRNGLAGRVVAGHACALSVLPEAHAARCLDLAAEAGLALTVLPTTNGRLQDAREGRTPRLRGLAPMQEARAAGMDVLIGLDNVQDAFFPFGDYDLIDAWRLAVLNAHLDPETWLDAITILPGRLTGLAPLTVMEGGPADFVMIQVASPSDLVSQPSAPRIVYRDGKPIGAAPSPALETA